VKLSSCKIPVILVGLNFLDVFSKNSQISNVIKICLVGAEFYVETDGQTDKEDEGNIRFSQFCERA
jgi:hypothetical protein